MAPFPPGEMRIGVDSTVLALKTLFDPETAAGFEADLELRLDGQRFAARVADGEFEVERGGAVEPDAAIEVAPNIFAELLWTGRSLADAERAGDASVEGSKQLVSMFLRMFPLPA
jgi:hypothetical protein